MPAIRQLRWIFGEQRPAFGDTGKAVDIKVPLTYHKGTNEVKRLVYEVSVDGRLWEKRVFRNR